MGVHLTSAMSSVEVTVWKPCVCQVVSQPEGVIY
jgi:hypothetical protein